MKSLDDRRWSSFPAIDEALRILFSPVVCLLTVSEGAGRASCRLLRRIDVCIIRTKFSGSYPKS